MSDRKTDILRAAIATFTRYGFRRSSMEDIAAEAGLSRPALYQYFKSKEDIILRVLDLVIDDAFAAAEARLDGQTTPREGVTAYLVTYLTFYHRLLVNSPHADELMDMKAGLAGDHHARAMTRLIARLRDLAGPDVSPDTAEILAHSGEGIKLHSPDEASLAARLTHLVHALV